MLYANISINLLMRLALVICVALFALQGCGDQRPQSVTSADVHEFMYELRNKYNVKLDILETGPLSKLGHSISNSTGTFDYPGNRKALRLVWETRKKASLFSIRGILRIRGGDEPADHICRTEVVVDMKSKEVLTYQPTDSSFKECQETFDRADVDLRRLLKLHLTPSWRGYIDLYDWDCNNPDPGKEEVTKALCKIDKEDGHFSEETGNSNSRDFYP